MEQFRERRRPSDSEAWMTAGSESTRIKLLNVSRQGMAVARAPDVPAGTLCRIEKGPLTVFATVRWKDGHRMGLALASPLTDTDAHVFGIR